MGSPLSVIISGCHAGPNPSPGLGTARSLRAAFPHAMLVARDFSTSASGLHDPVFDDVWLAPAWEGADLALLREQFVARLESSWFISGLDVEIRWLAAEEHPRQLIPGASALAAVAKPAIRALTALPVRLPEWLSLRENERAIERFCRRHDWHVWVKGPAHEARRARNWRELRERSAELANIWGTEGLFVQQHVRGQEVSLAYAAFRGELLDTVLLEKQTVTPEGKVWGGRIEPVPSALHDALAETLRNLEWTGGGELEFVRDAGGVLWLFDWNPRFPAWIHGATLAGHNLPAALLAAATGEPPLEAVSPADAFTRVVTEVPWRGELPLMHPSPIGARSLLVGKHPSGMPLLHQRLRADSVAPRTTAARALPPELAADLAQAARAIRETPARVVLARTASARFRLAAALRGEQGVSVAYSIKTNPDPRLMVLALEHGLLAEAISEAEVEWAKVCGWSPEQIIYNGPVPLPAPRPDQPRLRAAFADDHVALAHYLASPPAEVVGVRLRHPLAMSRFGLFLEDPETFEQVVDLLSGAAAHCRLGASFHLASSEVGMRQWSACIRDVIGWAGLIAELSGRPIEILDLGGGWVPEDFDTAVTESIPELARVARDILGSGADILIEPGKALAQPSLALFTRVVHLRAGLQGGREAVLDAGIHDVPLIHDFPHRIVSFRGDEARGLDPGDDVLLGPLCMEGDCLARGIALPPELRVGDLLAICDCGGYDAGMAYSFGRGGAGAHDRSPR